jgi:hypothetical protein
MLTFQPLYVLHANISPLGQLFLREAFLVSERSKPISEFPAYLHLQAHPY